MADHPLDLPAAKKYQREMTRFTLKCLIVLALMGGSVLTAAEESIVERRTAWFADLTQRAQAGDSNAQDQLGIWYGMMYAENRLSADGAQSVKWYLKAAEQGNAHAQDTLGFIYAYGDPVAQDKKEAVKWYRKAAEQGRASAQYNLGEMYSWGEGVRKDDVEAAKWYRKAAEQGHVSAQYSLGEKYRNGKGVPKDFVQAHAWINISAANGLELAKKMMPIYEKEMTPEQKAEAMKLARELFEKMPKE